MTKTWREENVPQQWRDAVIKVLHNIIRRPRGKGAPQKSLLQGPVSTTRPRDCYQKSSVSCSALIRTPHMHLGGYTLHCGQPPFCTAMRFTHPCPTLLPMHCGVPSSTPALRRTLLYPCTAAYPPLPLYYGVPSSTPALRRTLLYPCTAVYPPLPLYCGVPSSTPVLRPIPYPLSPSCTAIRLIFFCLSEAGVRPNANAPFTCSWWWGVRAPIMHYQFLFFVLVAEVQVVRPQC